MKNMTFKLSPDTISLINKIYALRIMDEKQTTKGKLISEALVLLAEEEQKSEANAMQDPR